MSAVIAETQLMARKKVVKKAKRLTKKPFLSTGQKNSLRRIMKTVRAIKIWNSQHGK